ncbi:unnamed protein product [Lepidochelys kempii]
MGRRAPSHAGEGGPGRGPCQLLGVNARRVQPLARQGAGRSLERGGPFARPVLPPFGALGGARPRLEREAPGAGAPCRSRGRLPCNEGPGPGPGAVPGVHAPARGKPLISGNPRAPGTQLQARASPASPGREFEPSPQRWERGWAPQTAPGSLRALGVPRPPRAAPRLARRAQLQTQTEDNTSVVPTHSLGDPQPPALHPRPHVQWGWVVPSSWHLAMGTRWQQLFAQLQQTRTAP